MTLPLFHKIREEWMIHWFLDYPHSMTQGSATHAKISSPDSLVKLVCSLTD